MTSMLTCEICLEKKTDRKPKSLICLHSFCRECLSAWVDTRSEGGDIECPVCRQNTKIPPAGIDGLVDDFKVLQLEEMMEAIGDPFVCQACLLKGRTAKAQVKCESCNRRLCEPCHRFHSNQKIFESHQIAKDLCDVHGNAVSHVCVTCFTGVCIDCVLSEVHESHDMCERDEGMGKLRKSVEDSQQQLKDLRNKIKLRMKTTEIKTVQEIELTIAKLKQAADAMKQEIDRQVTEVIKQYRKQTLQEMKKSFDEFENLNLPKSLDELEQETVTEQNMAKMAELNTELKKVMRQVRDAEERVPDVSEKPTIKDMLKEVGKPLSLHQYYDTYNESDVESRLRHTLFRDILEKPKLVRQYLEKDCEEIDVPYGLEIMDDFTALAAFKDRDHVARFDENGRVVASYYCHGAGDANKFRNVTTGDGNIYIQCKDRHTVIHILAGEFNRTIRHITNVPNKDYFSFNPFNNTFFLSSDEGKVFRCLETDMSPEECSFSPGCIRVLPYAGSYRIVVVSEYTHTVMVYDEDETLLYTLTGCGDNDNFNYPRDVSMLGHDTLLVADSWNHRLCKFRLSDGSFEGLLLTEEDKVQPWYIACKYPYLWVAGIASGRWTLQFYKWS